MFWTGVRLPAAPFKGLYWLRQGITSVTVDETKTQMLTTSFPSTAASLLPEMVDQVR